MSDKLIYNPTPKYGEWIDKEFEYRKMAYRYTCSKCGRWVYEKFNYCPECGANMTRLRENV